MCARACVITTGGYGMVSLIHAGDLEYIIGGGARPIILPTLLWSLWKKMIFNGSPPPLQLVGKRMVCCPHL